MFFKTGITTDPIYQRVRDRAVSLEADGRAFIEQISRDSAPFLDVDLADRAPANGLVPSFCEMYFAYALKIHGIKLVPRSRRTPKHKGPDLLAEEPDVWIEAVAATPGGGPDALEWGEPLKVIDIPVDRVVIRLRTAIESKAQQLKKHVARGYIKTGQAVVIAVSGCMLPYRYSEGLTPFIVRAVLGVGNTVLELDRVAEKPVGRYLEYHGEVRKACEAVVKTDLFLNDEYSHVSALLYSPSYWVHHPLTPGAEFTVVHNPRATNPLQDGWFRLGDEYWLNGSDLRHTRHDVNDWN